jgi:hypothetical protein
MSELNDDKFGFKRLSLENWLTVDPAWTGVLMSMSRSNQPEGFVYDLCQLNLSSSVPQPVRKLFETARGALVYSAMFYPLLTLGTEQLLRVFETAASSKCIMMNAPKIRNFSLRVDWLVKHGIISTEDSVRWESIVKLRNDASHPKDQNIFNLAIMLTILESAIELIDALFATSS